MENLLNQLIELATWENALQIALLLTLYFGTDKKAMDFIQTLKEWLGWKDRKAELLVVMVAVGVSIPALMLQGSISPETLTIENFAAMVITVTYAAQKRYERWKLERLENSIPDAMVAMTNRPDTEKKNVRM